MSRPSRQIMNGLGGARPTTQASSRSCSSRSAPDRMRRPGTTGSIVTAVGWDDYTKVFANNPEPFRGNWYYEAPGDTYTPIKGRVPGCFESQATPARWGLTEMSWWPRNVAPAVFGPSKYTTCGGMLTYTEAFNKSVAEQDPMSKFHNRMDAAHTRNVWDVGARSMARSAHSMHDLKMVGKLQRGSALVHQTPY